MKPTHLLLILLIQVLGISQALVAQYDTTHVQSYFTTVHGDSSQYHAPSNMIEFEDGYYGFESISTTEGRHLEMVKYSFKGLREFVAVVYDQEDYLSLFGGKRSVKNEMSIVSCVTLYINADNYNMLVFEVDLDGNILWQQSFDTNYYEDIDQIVKTQDGGYLLVGGYDPFGGTNYMWVVKLDESGDIEWNKTINELDTWSTALNVVEYDNFYIFGGGGVIDDYWKPWLVKLSKTGEFIDEYHITDEYFDCRCGVYKKLGSPDLFYLRGCLNSYNNYFALVDTNFNMIWDKIEPDQHDFGNALPDQLPNGNFRYVSSHEEESGWDQIYMVERDSLFEVVYAQKINVVPEKHVYTRDFRKTSDGGYIIAAYEHFPSPQRGWVIKTDSLGNTCWGENCDSIVYTIDTLTSDNLLELNRYAGVYPNPVKDKLTLMHSLSTSFNHLTWQVTDMYGREVWSEDLMMNDASIELDASHLSNGLYLFRLLDDGELIKSGKFVVGR